MPNTDEHAEKGPLARVETKVANVIAAREAEQHQSTPTVQSAPVTPNQVAQEAGAETTDTKAINMGQGENANGEADSKKVFEAGQFQVQGHTKITREAGDEDTGKPSPADVVQQGGGGAIDVKSGNPA